MYFLTKTAIVSVAVGNVRFIWDIKTILYLPELFQYKTILKIHKNGLILIHLQHRLLREQRSDKSKYAHTNRFFFQNYKTSWLPQINLRF